MFERLAVILVDQAPGPDRNLRAVLANCAAARVVAECSYGRNVSSVIREMDADVVVIRLREPSPGSLRSLAIASLARPQIPVIAIVPNNHRSVFELTRKAVQAGASDLLLAPVKAADLDNALWNAKAAAERRRLAALDDPVILVQPEVFLVVSPKGGVGKSTLAVNLAAKLASVTDETVAVIDLDSLSGSSAKMLGVESIPFQALEGSQDPTREDIRDLLRRGGSQLSVIGVSSPDVRDGRGVNAESAIRMIGRVGRASDFIIVDTPPAGFEELAPLIEAASLCFLVTTPDFTSIASIGSFLQASQGIPFFSDKVKIVLNQDGLKGGAERSIIERALGRSIFWCIPYDSKAITAAGLGVPLVHSYPCSKAAKSMADLLYVITGYREPTRRLFQNLLPLFRHRPGDESRSELTGADVAAEALVRYTSALEKVTEVSRAGNHG